MIKGYTTLRILKLINLVPPLITHILRKKSILLREFTTNYFSCLPSLKTHAKT